MPAENSLSEKITERKNGYPMKPTGSLKSKGIGRVMRLFVVLILIVSFGVFVNRMIRYSELSRQKEQLQSQKAAYEQKIDEINYRLNSPVDYEDIIRIAREKLGLAFPDDTVYYGEQGSAAD